MISRVVFDKSKNKPADLHQEIIRI